MATEQTISPPPTPSPLLLAEIAECAVRAPHLDFAPWFAHPEMRTATERTCTPEPSHA